MPTIRSQFERTVNGIHSTQWVSVNTKNLPYWNAVGWPELKAAGWTIVEHSTVMFGQRRRKITVHRTYKCRETGKEKTIVSSHWDNEIHCFEDVIDDTYYLIKTRHENP